MHSILLIEEQARKTLASIVTSNIQDREWKPKASAFEEYEKSGRTAVIPIKGILTEEPDFCAMIFGGGNTTYKSIRKLTEQAEADSTVASIVYEIDSPGGEAVGMFKAADSIFETSKPTKAVITGMAASAAYCLASQADTVEADNRAVSAGSIGVVTTLWKDSDRKTTITSSKAPLKRPDPETEEGKAAIQERLDALEDLFHETIARKREIKDYGQGKVFLADKALEMGFIDKMTEVKKIKEGAMKLEELKANHPDLYAQVKQEGTVEERERVQAHAIYGKSSGQYDLAFEAIEKGDQVTEVYKAKYLTAKSNREELEKLESETTGAGSTPEEKGDKELEKIVLKEMGVYSG